MTSLTDEDLDYMLYNRDPVRDLKNAIHTVYPTDVVDKPAHQGHVVKAEGISADTIKRS